MTTPAPRLLCDEMLAGLARWLRAAGYDTALLSPGVKDAALVARARADGRVLLTRDGHLAAMANGVDVIRLASDRLDEQAREVAKRLRVDWTLAPFTRCLIDNMPLREATAAELASMPDSSRMLPGPWRACPACRRVYWPGSHVRRMAARLERWAGQANIEPGGDKRDR